MKQQSVGHLSPLGKKHRISGTFKLRILTCIYSTVQNEILKGEGHHSNSALSFTKVPKRAPVGLTYSRNGKNEESSAAKVSLVFSSDIPSLDFCWLPTLPSLRRLPRMRYLQIHTRVLLRPCVVGDLRKTQATCLTWRNQA